MMRFGPDVVRLARKLVEGCPAYFSRDSLNSGGGKVFEEMARMLVEEHPELKQLVVRARERPTLENVRKVLDRVLGEEQVDTLLRTAVQGPYEYGWRAWLALERARSRSRLGCLCAPEPPGGR